MVYSMAASKDDRVGVHGMFVLRGVPPAVLERADDVKGRLWAVARDCRLNVVAEGGHQFSPVGVTHVLVLAESHMSIHTYPEHGRAYVDLFTCVLDFDMQLAVSALRRHFGGDAVEVDYKAFFR